MQFVKLNFNIKIFAIFFLNGMCLSIFFYHNKDYLFLLFFILFVFILFYNYNRSNKSTPYISLILFSLTIGFTFICWNIEAFKRSTSYLSELENVRTLVQGTVTGVPYIKNRSTNFDFLISNSTKVRLVWFDAPYLMSSGDCWQLYVKLKKPRNFSTPGSFDIEKHMFSERITAIGKVINDPKNVLKSTYYNQSFNFNFFIDRLRQKIINKIHNQDNNFHLIKKNIILALSLGVKYNISNEDIVILRNTGTSHLLAISGLHISFIAGVGFWLTSFLWKKYAPVYWLEKFPAAILASVVSICCATLYFGLSGCGISTKRACVMSVLSLLAIVFRRTITTVQIYCYALILVLIMEPFAILSNGFWLSFIAVGILLYKNPANLISTNLYIFIGLLPINCLIFGNISLISLVANFFAVPYFSMFILPWVFVGILLYGLFNIDIGLVSLKFADLNLQLLMFVLNKLQNIEFVNINIAIPNIFIFILSSIGSIWILLPKGLINRWLAIFCFLPLFINKQEVIDYGNAIVSFLDVGQGLAAIIKLKNHVLLYDVGPNNKVVVNYLNNFNQHVIEKIIISHTDLDHIGGLEDVVKNNIIKNFITNNRYKIFNLTASLCNINQSWSLDGVIFEFLHPNDDHHDLVNKNDNSCVLKISTATYSVLLTGDISKKAEQILVKNYYNKLKADLLLIPHHGSKHSSSLAFIEAVQPKYAVVSAGYMNQYRHPRSVVLNKYLSRNIEVFNTIEHGTVDFIIKSDTIAYNCYRINHNNFWNY